MFFSTWETCIWSYTEFVYPECWHFDYGATSKIDDVLTGHGELLHVLPVSIIYCLLPVPLPSTPRFSQIENVPLLLFVGADVLVRVSSGLSPYATRRDWPSSTKGSIKNCDEPKCVDIKKKPVECYQVKCDH